MLVLGIETSCDETAAAVVDGGGAVLSSVVASSLELHKIHGGIVPEIASRAHIESISQVVEAAVAEAGAKLSDIDAVAVTYAPGLIGALLVGVSFAKSLAYGLDVPLIPVHHLRGHIAAGELSNPELKPPYLALIVSGGHTELVDVRSHTEFVVLGATIDDACGEAYDKAARALGLSYPGGAEIERKLLHGDKNRYKLPRPRTGNLMDFSFSGLKTAVLNLVNNAKQKGEEISVPCMCAAFQFAVCDILEERVRLALEATEYCKLLLCGGVAANAGIRHRLRFVANDMNADFYSPAGEYCGDNAAMIAAAGLWSEDRGPWLDLNGYASMGIENSL